MERFSVHICDDVLFFAYFLFREYRIRLDNVTLKNFVFLAFALTFYYICTSFYAFFIIKQYIMKKQSYFFCFSHGAIRAGTERRRQLDG